jgi:hypothetical protein
MAKDSEVPDTGAARLSIPLTPDGRIDLGRMRPSTAQKLVDLIRTDPTVRETLDEGKAQEDTTVDLFGGITEENVSKGLDLLQAANALFFRIGAAKWIKHPLLKDAKGNPVPLILDEKILSQAFALTPEQHKELDPRATRLAEKYSGKLPDWLKENLDLYMFCSMFLTYTAQNAKLAIETQVKMDYARAHKQMMDQQQTARNPQSDSDVRRPANGEARRTAEELDSILKNQDGTVTTMPKDRPAA